MMDKVETAEEAVVRILRGSREAVDRLWDKVGYVSSEEVHSLVCALDELAMVAIRERKEAISWRDRYFEMMKEMEGGEQ